MFGLKYFYYTYKYSPSEGHIVEGEGLTWGREFPLMEVFQQPKYPHLIITNTVQISKKDYQKALANMNTYGVIYPIKSESISFKEE